MERESLWGRWRVHEGVKGREWTWGRVTCEGGERECVCLLYLWDPDDQIREIETPRPEYPGQWPEYPAVTANHLLTGIKVVLSKTSLAILILEGLHYQNLGVGRQLSDHVPCICAEMEHSTKIYLHHCYQWHDCSLGNPSSMLLQSIPLSGDAPTSCQPWPATKGTYWSWVTSKCKGEFEDSQTK